MEGLLSTGPTPSSFDPHIPSSRVLGNIRIPLMFRVPVGVDKAYYNSPAKIGQIISAL